MMIHGLFLTQNNGLSVYKLIENLSHFVQC